METHHDNQPEHQRLFQTFADSQWGADLVGKTRFNVFKPDWVSTEQWTGMLGDDVNNLLHMPHTYTLAERFCEGEGLDDETSDTLLTTAIVHDWGEAIIGDIPLPDKNTADEKAELVAFATIADKLLGNVRGQALTSRVWAVLGHENKEHGSMFRAIEYLGYCTTALRAKRVADCLAANLITIDAPRRESAQLIGGLLSMHKAVEGHNFPTLAGYTKKYSSLKSELWKPQ
jgi:hypothetical protein